MNIFLNILLALLFEQIIDAKFINVQLDLNNNIASQTKKAKTEINVIIDRIKKMQDYTLEIALNKTRLGGFSRMDSKSNNGLPFAIHAMRTGTPLDGYFTADVPLYKHYNVRNFARLFFKQNPNGNVLCYGMVDTHGYENVKKWNKIADNLKNKFFKMYNEVWEVYYGVKKVLPVGDNYVNPPSFS